MDIGGVTNQVANELKGLGQETGQQLGQAGEEIVKGTVNELLGGDQGGQVKQGNREGVSQQAPVMNEMEELKQRKKAENVEGLKRVRSQLENYRQWQKQLKEELKDEGKIKEEQVKVAKKEEKKSPVKDFWKGFLGKTRSQYAGTGEMVKAKH